ncbi:MAG: vWA domain-containing protein, partial [Anaerolineae bacterium]
PDELFAAHSFVADTDLALHRVGIVGFASSPSPSPIGLSQDSAAINGAIDALSISPGTDIAAAIDAAALLLEDRRVDALPVVILMSDGSPNSPSPDPRAAAITSANFAKLDGIVIYTIGLGSDADYSLMEALASSPDQYYYAPDGADLTAIYEDIAVVVGAAALTDLTLEDDLYADVELLPGSAAPSASVSGQRLTWQTAVVSSAGTSWTYVVTPTKAGKYPTNDRAAASFTNADGSPDEFVFPQPIIEVVDPNAKDPCTSSDAWTVMVHSFPDSVGVSGGGRPGCNNSFDSGDWFGGTNPPLPRLEYQLLDGSGERLLDEAMGAPAAGRVDQRINLRACEPPPYTLRLVTTDLNGYDACFNSPLERTITARDFQRSFYRSTEERYGFVLY